MEPPPEPVVEEPRYEKIKPLRHDIKNHNAVVKELLPGGRVQEAVFYIGEKQLPQSQI